MDASEAVHEDRVQHRFCEVCSRSAAIPCVHCKVTFYCTEAHKQLDWESIHQEVCNDYAILRGPQPFLPEGRQKRMVMENQRLKKADLLDIAFVKSQLMLSEGNTSKAVPAAITAMKLAKEVYGKKSIQLIPPYCVTTEIFLDLGKVSQAQGALSQAQWLSEKMAENDPLTLSYIYSARGRFNWYFKKFDPALQDFANHVYLLAEVNGTEHVLFANGLYYLAMALFQIDKEAGGISCFVKTSNVWQASLLNFVTLEWLHSRNSEPYSAFGPLIENKGASVLQSIIDWCQTLPEPDTDILRMLFKTSHALAMLNVLRNDIKKAKRACHTSMMALNAIRPSLQDKVLDTKEIRHAKFMFGII